MNVYDFDNTVYDGESAVDFFLFSLKKYPSLAKYIPIMAFMLIKYKMCRITVEELEKCIKKYAVQILNKIGDPKSFCCEFWDKNFYKVKDFYINQSKEDDLILSATADFLIEEFSKRVGGVQFISSEIDLKTGEIKRICFRKNKVSIFMELYPKSEVEEFYTDSLNDMPMIELSKKAFMVKGKRIKRIK